MSGVIRAPRYLRFAGVA